MRETLTSPDGWELEVETDYQFPVPATRRCRLYGLRITLAQGAAITQSGRPCGSVQHSLSFGGGMVKLHGIELTGDEAQAIVNGADPLAIVLRPPAPSGPPRVLLRAVSCTE